MKIDTSRLKNVVKKPNGEIVSQCPACNAAGHDTTGNHLIVYPDWKFGCVAHQGDTDHNKEILGLVGVKDDMEFIQRRVTIRPFTVPPSQSVVKVPRRTLEELGLKRGATSENEVKCNSRTGRTGISKSYGIKIGYMQTLTTSLISPTS